MIHDLCRQGRTPITSPEACEDLFGDVEGFD